MRRYTITNKREQLPLIPAPGPGSYDIDTYVQKLNITTGFVSDRSHYVSYSYGHIRRVPQQYYASHIPRFPFSRNNDNSIGPGQYNIAATTKPRALSLINKRNNQSKSNAIDSITKKLSLCSNIGPGCYDINYNQVRKKSAVLPLPGYIHMQQDSIAPLLSRG